MLSVADISKRLSDRAEAVCQLLLPGGAIIKNEWVCGDVNGHAGKSLHVHLNGGHAGEWRDWANQDDKGDLLDLWERTKHLSRGEAIQEAKRFLGIMDPERKEKKKYAPAPEKPTPVPNPQGRAFRWLTETRKLTPETISAFRIGIETGERPCIVFPCYSPTGILINRSYRTLPPPGQKKDVWQDKGCAPCLFGWQALPRSAYESGTIILTEGQIDCCTWHQWGFPALSIPNGGGQTWIEYSWDDLEAFDTIYIGFDMDGAGRENAEKAVKRLGAHRCLLISSMLHKDANAALQAGAGPVEAQQWLSEAKHPEFQGLITAKGLTKRLFADLAPKPKPFTMRFFDKAWPLDGLYFRPAEVTVWTGAYGNGKSTFLNTMAVAMLDARINVFMASMEAKAEVTLRKMALALLTGIVGFHFTGDMFRNANGHEFTQEQGYQIFLNEAGDHLVFADVVGYIQRDRLLDMMLYSFRKYDCQHFFIDSLMRIEGLEEDYPAQGEFMNRLQEFAKDTNAHVHLVCHPRKLEKGGKPSGTDTKGSSVIPNNADNIAAVIRNWEKAEILKEGRDLTEEERKMHDTEILVDKQRDTGWVGSFFFKFDRRDYTFTPCNRYQKPKQAPKNQNWHDRT